MAILTQALLRTLLHYNPETGIFTRLHGQRCPQSLIGKQAGTTKADDYVCINVAGKKYRAHRLAWLYMLGEWPNEMVDHIDGIKANNRWSNLRAADMALNQQNQKRAHTDSKTGVLGVTFTPGGRFKAQISQNKRLRYLGTFATVDEASAARAAALSTGATS